MALKHVAFAPASQKQLGSRLRSPLLRRETLPAQPFSRFFHHTAFAQQGNPMKLGVEGVRPYHTECHKGKNAGKYLLPMARPDPGELRSRREERMENGV